MLMGTRLYYVFYGSTVSSDASLEGKVEELCRELGDRGKGMEPVASDGLAQQLSEASQRVPVLLDSLESAARSLMAVSRQERKAVMQRVMAMQDSLESEDVAAWVGAEWTAEQCVTVSESMTCVMSMQSSKEVSNSEAVMSAVVDLLSSLDS
eukprot:COSAG01_NODE_41011_length_456_cov_20.397759_1_plen_151_part_11